MDIQDKDKFDWLFTVKTSRLGKVCDIDIYSDNPELEKEIQEARLFFTPDFLDLMLFHLAQEIEVCEFNNYGSPRFINDSDGGHYAGETTIYFVDFEDFCAATRNDHDAYSEAIESLVSFHARKAAIKEAA